MLILKILQQKEERRAGWKCFHFDSDNGEFREGIVLRYCWEFVKTPSTCACGETFNVAQALHCPKFDYTHISPNGLLYYLPICS